MNTSIMVPVSLATELISRLKREGIAARIMETTIYPEFGQRSDMTYVILDSTDAETANRVLDQFRHDFAEMTTTDKCSCGYDLQGHLGHDECPECGKSINAPSPDIDCDGCGEPVPLHFDVCWNCGKALEGLD